MYMAGHSMYIVCTFLKLHSVVAPFRQIGPSLVTASLAPPPTNRTTNRPVISVLVMLCSSARAESTDDNSPPAYYVLCTAQRIPHATPPSVVLLARLVFGLITCLAPPL